MSVTVGGATQTGWTLDGATIAFATPPGNALEVRSSFTFDVPVRFAEDRLSIDVATFMAGEAASVPLIEVREDLA